MLILESIIKRINSCCSVLTSTIVFYKELVQQGTVLSCTNSNTGSDAEPGLKKVRTPSQRNIKFIMHEFRRKHVAGQPTQIILSGPISDTGSVVGGSSLAIKKTLVKCTSGEGHMLLNDNINATFNSDIAVLKTRNGRTYGSQREYERPVQEEGGSDRESTTQTFVGVTDKNKARLTTMYVVCIMFCNCIGGGYGLEESIQSGGALVPIILILILPIVWCLPISMVVTEISTSIPTNGGFLMWCNTAFPAPVYFFSMLLELMLMFIDNATYPTLFADYVCTSFDCASTTRTMMKLVCLMCVCILNLVGVHAVGIAAMITTVISVSPLVLIFICHMGKDEGYINWDNVRAIPPDIDWVTLVSTITWNLSGIENTGSIVENIVDPHTTMMKAFPPFLVLIWLSYILPILAGVSLHKGQKEDFSIWVNGYWTTVAYTIGGRGLKMLTVIGGMFSAIGMSISAICVTSTAIAGVGETGALPTPISNLLFTYNKAFGTPHWAIILNICITSFFAISFNFSYLIVMSQAVNGIRVCLIFIGAIRLRYSFPTLNRPFQIPLGTDGMVLWLTPPLLFSLTLTVLCVTVDVITTCIFFLILVTAMLVSYFYCSFMRPYGFNGRIVELYYESDDHSTNVDSYSRNGGDGCGKVM